MICQKWSRQPVVSSRNSGIELFSVGGLLRRDRYVGLHSDSYVHCIMC